MPSNEPEPLGLRMIPGCVAGDIVAHGRGFLAIAQDFTPDGNDASGVGEAVFHGTCGKDGDGALLDAAVPFLRGAVAGLGFGKGCRDRFEQIALVSFDLQEIFAAIFHDGTGGFVLVVERIGGDGFAVERRELFKQVLRGP